jgi:16S rRNA (adenine1518-N6/adenine1519-N6)-dimethyltransferase
VRSSVIRLEFGPPTVRLRDPRLFERLVKGLFGQRRKTLANAIKAVDPLGPAVLALSGFDGRRRPETLQVAELATLADLLTAARQGGPVV